MVKYSENTMLGLKALQRAADKVFEIARKNNTKIPVWIDGSIQFKIPQKITKHSVAPDVQVTLS